MSDSVSLRVRFLIRDEGGLVGVAAAAAAAALLSISSCCLFCFRSNFACLESGGRPRLGFLDAAAVSGVGGVTSRNGGVPVASDCNVSASSKIEEVFSKFSRMRFRRGDC